VCVWERERERERERKGEKSVSDREKERARIVQTNLRWKCVDRSALADHHKHQQKIGLKNICR